MQIRPGDYVLLVSREDKTYLIQVVPGGQVGTHHGVLPHDDVIGRRYGEVVTTHLGKAYALMKPTLADRMMKVRRRTQIIYPKDAGLIVLKCGLGNGSRVIECGTGSGSLTMVLANAVGPDGRVFSYDRREEFTEIARSNVAAAGLEGRVEFKVRDVAEGFDEEGVDAVVLDLPAPWEGVGAAARALVGGGRIASLSPTYNQVEKTVEALRGAGFIRIETLEVLVRQILVRPGKTRPADRMIAHTGYLTFARKALLEGGSFYE